MYLSPFLASVVEFPTAIALETADNANSMTYIVICVVVLAILVAAIAVARKGRNRKKSHKRR